MKLYIYPKCSTCKKASKFLTENEIAINPIDISITPPSKAELKKMLNVFDGNIRKLFNTSGLQYRELNLKEKLADMSEEQALAILSENGMLVKRPFLLTTNSGTVGFKQSEWEQLI